MKLRLRDGPSKRSSRPNMERSASPEFRALTDLPNRCRGAAPSNVEVDADDDDDEIDAVDAVDAELFPIFEEEGQELLPQLAARLARLGCARRPTRRAPAARDAHAAHAQGRRAAGRRDAPGRDVPPARSADRASARARRRSSRRRRSTAGSRGDALMAAFEALRAHDAQAYAEAATAARACGAGRAGTARALEDPLAEPDAPPRSPSRLPAQAVATRRASRKSRSPAVGRRTARDRLVALRRRAPPPQVADRATAPASPSAVRVRAPLLDRMVNQAGEVSITRTRIEAEVGLIKSSLGDLTREPRTAAPAVARNRTAGRDADELAARGSQGGRRELRPAGVRPLHALPGTDAHDGRVGQRRGHGAAHAAARRRERRGRTGGADPAHARPAGRPAAHAHGRVREPGRPACTASCARRPRKPASRCGSTSSAARSNSTAACSTA